MTDQPPLEARTVEMVSARDVLRTTSVTLTASHGISLTRMLGDANTDAILTALGESGMVVVPREPTEAMVAAAGNTTGMQEVDGLLSFCATSRNMRLHWGERGEQAPIVQAWRAMIDAATPNQRKG